MILRGTLDRATARASRNDAALLGQPRRQRRQSAGGGQADPVVVRVIPARQL
jgi:hypothetical protein